MSYEFHQADCFEWMREQPSSFVNHIFTSPPYEDARMYGELDFNLRGDAWVDWAVPRFLECLRICDGPVAWVVNGRTQNYEWSATPIKLMHRLIEHGVTLRKPPVFERVGIPGSGGRAADHAHNGGSADWLKDNYEFVIMATRGGKLPWADTLACGSTPKYPPGGPPSHRKQNGKRVAKESSYKPPTIANPGNVIRCSVGGGLMGSKLAHENEAPFPQALAEFFVRSFCPPGGTVLDPFSGSGTTVAAALKWGRRGIGIDIRQSQIELGERRMAEILPRLVA